MSHQKPADTVTTTCLDVGIILSVGIHGDDIFTWLSTCMDENASR